MNKNTIIALVIGLVIGGLAIWLFMFFAQGSSLGTAIGLSKTGGTTIDWSKYIVQLDAKHFTLKNGATGNIYGNTVEIKAPGVGTQARKAMACTCSYDPAKLEGRCDGTCNVTKESENWYSCGGTCTGEACLTGGCDWEEGTILDFKPAGGGGEYR